VAAGERVRGRVGEGGRAGGRARACWVDGCSGTVFKRKEKERGESSEWLVHY